MLKEKYSKLIKDIQRADYCYYSEDKPEISDAAYDALMQELIQMETEHPDLISSTSPTQRVGGKVSGTFSKMKHPIKMLSLNNVFNEKDLNAFYTRTGEQAFIVEPKLDGLTLVCWYDKGKLLKATTRGDGEVGENVTHTARTIKNLPLTVPYTKPFQVRGEVVMPKSAFMKYNKNALNHNTEPLCNTRAGAAGAIRQKDPAKAAKRSLLVFFYDVINVDDFSDENGKLLWLENQRLPTIVSSSNTVGKEELFQYCLEMQKMKSSCDIDIDGAVIKVLQLSKQQLLGTSAKAPNWAVAYKFEEERYTTTLKEVVWQVGRTGQVTPVALIDPVDIQGTICTHASLHNEDYINNLKLRTGDVVTVYKAAEIIPQIDEVSSHSQYPRIIAPENCPACHSKLERKGAALMCKNNKCSARLKNAIEFFGSREHMNIQGLGKATVDLLVPDIVRIPPDIYNLTKEWLLKLEGFAGRKADSLIEQIQLSRKQPYHKVIASLGIHSMGDTLSVDICRKFQNIDKLLAASTEDLKTLPGISDITANNIYSSLHSATMQAVIAGLRPYLVFEYAKTTSTPLEGVSICITGTLSFSREYFKELIIANGGVVTSSVTKDTTYLLAGEAGGSKLTKAKNLSIKIITEQEFLNLIKKV